MGCTVWHRRLANGPVSIHYVECGPADGRLVVLLHGFPSFWYTWKYQLGPLSRAGYHVVAPDLRGYNLSSKPKNVADYGRTALLSDVAAIIDQKGGGAPAILVGHDWGGNIAWSFAHDFPEKLQKLAVLNIPHPNAFWKTLRRSPRQMGRSWYIFLFQIPGMGETLLSADRFRGLRSIVQDDLVKPQPDEHIQRHIEAFSRPHAMTSAILYYRSLFRKLWDRPPTSRDKIELPVAVIWGEKETVFNEDLAEPPSDLVVNCRVKRVPEATHWVMWDEPELVTEHLLSFFSEDSEGADPVSKL